MPRQRPTPHRGSTIVDGSSFVGSPAQRSTNRPRQLIDFVVCVVERERWTHRALQSEAIHGRLRAMMPSPNGYPFLVEDLAHFFRRDVVGDERCDAGFFRRSPDQPNTRDAAQSVMGIRE